MRLDSESRQGYFSEAWSHKSFWGRLILLGWSLVVFKYIWANEQVPGVWNPLWTVSHGIHEIGHWITRPFGMWVSVASGSIFQFLFPFVFMGGFVRSRDPHAVALLCTWQAANLVNMAHYAGSAEYSDLLLQTPHYITLYHDWVWMLSRLNALPMARTIEDIFYAAALGFLFLSIVGQAVSLAFIWQFRTREND